MAEGTLTSAHLRDLADVHPESGRVISVFLNLDPGRFGNAAARTTAINSVVNEATHAAEQLDGLDHEERQALRDDLQRIDSELRRNDLAVNGTRGVAIFACAPAGLFEVIQLDHTVENHAMVNRTPHLEPLVRESHERWCVILCNRRSARIFVGEPHALRETDRIDDDVHSQHDQGGWSQARFQRGVEKEAIDHIKHVAEVVFESHKQEAFDAVLVSAPEASVSDLEAALHPYLRERLKGRIHCDIENSSPDDVRRLSMEVIEQAALKREGELLERLSEGIGRNSRAAAGVGAVLEALNQSRVEALLVQDGFRVEGGFNPSTGMLSSGTGEGFEPVGNVVEEAIQKAIEQSAEVVVMRTDGCLDAHGGVGALLRF